MDFRATG